MTVTFHWQRPVLPALGDVYFDPNKEGHLVFDGSKWVMFASVSDPKPEFVMPTAEQLEKYPSLKEAWENFLIVQRLCGTQNDK